MDFQHFLGFSIIYILLGVSNIHCKPDEVCFSPSFNRTIPDLSYDEAYLVIEVDSEATYIFYGISSNCYKCPLQVCANNTGNEIKRILSTKISSRFPFHYSLNDVQGKTVCSGTFHFGEHGHYKMTTIGLNKCTIVTEKKPSMTYLPLIIMFAVIIFASIVYTAGSHFYRKYELKKYGNYAPIGEDDASQSDRLSNSDRKSLESSSQYGSIPPHSNSKNFLGGISLNSRASPRVRLKSLDTFRGISIIIMIFVNYGGGKYWFFNHSKWNGLTVADLVFPWFIFIMGASIFISCRSLRRKSVSKLTISKKIIFRTIKLFAIGLFINNGCQYDTWRIPGVLQRFAGSYFVVAMLNVWLSPEGDKIDIHYNYDWRDTIRDLTWFPLQHLAMLILLLVYLCLTFLLPVEGCPTGYLGPGGIAVDPKYGKCTGGAAAYIDKKIFGLKHIYNRPTCSDLYQCAPHDPEGLLGVIPSILLTYLGLMASRILFMYSRPISHIKRWMVWSVLLGCIAIGLCEGKRDGGLIPINKNLWSLSFIFATASMAFFLLAACYVLIDIKRIWSGAPFSFAGMNAILLYCGHEILGNYFPFNFKNNNQHDELLTRSAVGTFVWTLVAYACYRTGTFLKL